MSGDDGDTNTEHSQSLPSPPAGKIPMGIAVLSILQIAVGAFQLRVHSIAILASDIDAEKTVSMSVPFMVYLFSDLAISIVAVSSGVGMFLGFAWAWWLAVFYWSWRLCNQVLLPSILKSVGHPSIAMLGRNAENISLLIGGATMFGAILIYLNRRKTLIYFNIDSDKRFRRSIVLVFGAGLLTLMLHAVKVALA